MTDTIITEAPGAVLEYVEADDAYGIPAHWSVTPVWPNVDRPISSSWSVGQNPGLGRRLVNAIEAGVVCTNPKVMTDVNGQTYVSHDGHLRVSGRRMNADLKRLGF